MSAIELRVYGEPQPQGNKTGFVNKKSGKVVMTEGRRKEARENFKDWRAAVAGAARDWQADHGDVSPIDAPVAVEATFWLTKPSSLPKWRWLPWSRPDADKLVRAVLDGISKILIRDDGRVVDLRVRKRYALERAPGSHIVVRELDERDELTRNADEAGPGWWACARHDHLGEWERGEWTQEDCAPVGTFATAQGAHEFLGRAEAEVRARGRESMASSL